MQPVVHFLNVVRPDSAGGFHRSDDFVGAAYQVDLASVELLASSPESQELLVFVAFEGRKLAFATMLRDGPCGGGETQDTADLDTRPETQEDAFSALLPRLLDAIKGAQTGRYKR